MSVRPLLALTTGLLLVGLTAPGCGKKEELPAKGAAQGDGGGKGEPASKALGKPDVTMDAAAWHAEFKKDADAARAKYKDKVIELSGTVDAVMPSPFGDSGNVFLEVPKETIGVQCRTTEVKPWKKVSPGSKVKIRGKVSEFGRGELVQAEIVEAGLNPGVVISAEQLAKEFVADRAAARKKYHDKWAYVTGDVLERTSEKYCWVLLKLKGEGDVTVNCCFGEGAYKKPVEPIKAGSKVDVFGRLSVYDGPKDKVIHLNMCELTSAK